MANPLLEHGRIGLLGLALVLVTTSCGRGESTAASPAAPSSTVAPASPAAPSPAPIPAAFSLTAALTVTLQDEYHAEAVYERVLVDFGNVFPFANIIRAEQTHAASLAGLFRSRGLAAPANVWDVNNVPRFGSVREACGAAAQAEVDNVAVYDKYVGEALPDNVRRVFENNRAASLNNHLPAFTRCK